MSTQTLAKHYANLITELGEDITRPGLKDTPERAAKAISHLTSGYHTSLTDIVNNALFPATTSEMVIVKQIELYSLCEHHLLPFIGQCHVGYLPKGQVLGVSKIARIVDMFSRRLQIQELLTSQIAHAIMEATGAEGAGVIIEAKHLCMMMRGVEKQNSIMSTSVMLGQFRDSSATRIEFLNLLGIR
jgi:GTP cyclohydrolase I